MGLVRSPEGPSRDQTQVSLVYILYHLNHQGLPTVSFRLENQDENRDFRNLVARKTYSLKIVTVLKIHSNEPINFVLWLTYNIDSQTGKVFGNCESSINKKIYHHLRKQLKMAS